MGLLIRQGDLVTPLGLRRADLRIVGGTIQAIGVRLSPAAGDQVLDASDCVVLPGLIDPHVHLALQSGPYCTVDDFAQGTVAAACGGVTTLLDFVTPEPGQSLLGALSARRAEMTGLAIDVGLHGTVTSPAHLEELPGLVSQGITSVKLYTTYRAAGLYADDALITTHLARARTLGILTLVHAENDALVEAAAAELIAAGRTHLSDHPARRPPLAEVEAVHRVLFLAQQAGAPVYIVHVSTGQAADLLAAARARGQMAFGETGPHYLLREMSDYTGDRQADFLMTPPLRTANDRDRLWSHLAAGTFDAIGTDHCGFTRDQKQVDDWRRVAYGIPGLETTLPLLYTYGVLTGRITWPRLVALTSAGPARLFGLAPQKGLLLPGADADLVIYDPTGDSVIQARRLHSAAGYSPFDGMPVRGRVRYTIARGRIVCREGEWVGVPGAGRFVPRQTFPVEPGP